METMEVYEGAQVLNAFDPNDVNARLAEKKQMLIEINNAKEKGSN